MKKVFEHFWKSILLLACMLFCGVCIDGLSAQTCEGRICLKDGARLLYMGHDRIEMPRKKRDVLAYRDFFSSKCKRDTIAVGRIDSVVVWNTAAPQYARVLVPIDNVGWCWAYVCHPKLQVYIYSSQGYSLNSMGGMKAWQGNTAAAMFLIPSKTACDFYVLQPGNTPVCLGDVYKKCDKAFVRKLCHIAGVGAAWEQKLLDSGEVNRSSMVLKVVEILDSQQ